MHCEFREELHLDGAQQGFRGPKSQADLKNSFGRRLPARGGCAHTRHYCRYSRGLSGKSLKYQAAVRASKSERVGQRVLDRNWTCVIRHVVEVALGIGILVIDGGRSDLVADREDSD